MRILQRMCRELIGALFSVFAGALLLCTSGTSASASVTYNWLCDVPTCNGDPSFSSTLIISDSAFAAGSFTGVAGTIS